MSIGSWSPDAENAKKYLGIDPETIQVFIGYSRNKQLDRLDQLLSAEQQSVQSGLMQLEPAQWSKFAENLEDDDIIHLIRFFTIAEQLPGWQAADKSPVISLAKTLRQRGQKLERELLLWIREHSDNRFLPYGSVL